MKTRTEYLQMETRSRFEFVRITSQVQDAIVKSGVKEGLVLINPMHITAAVIVNDNEAGLQKDYLAVLERLVPYGADYRHNDTGEDNAASHIWRQLMGHQVVMPITNGKLDLGTWEQIFYCEFDGQRKKRVLVKVIGE
jgi:secondary thiamine-phosphate synthase enzyme